MFRSELKRWLYLQSWPTSLKQIYGAETSNGKEVRCFDERFRATIPIYSHRSHFYTSFDFEQKKIAGKTTIYLSPTGDDANDGLLPAKAKKSIESAIQTHAKTIILQEGNYRAGVNFKNGTSISDLNLIGEGRVIIDNMGANPLVIRGKAFIRNIEFINGNWGSLRTYIENPHAVCTYIKCKFNHSLVDNEEIGKAKSLGGLRIQGGTHYIYV